MGHLANLLDRFLPERKAAVGATMPVWEASTPQSQPYSYHTYASEGYSSNEIVYAVIEERATSLAEPELAAYRKTAKEPEKLPNHPLLDLIERPNPFLDRFTFFATLSMYLDIAGNAYIEKVLTRGGEVMELWFLRPDRVEVIPDRQRFIGGYKYEIGTESAILPAESIIHIRNRNPLNDYYGLPMLAPAAAGIDIDNWARSFTRSFFANAGVPAGLLNIKSAATREQKEYLQAMFHRQHGSGNWHRLMVLDGGEATYTQMGLPLGDQGLVLPDLDEMREVRGAMPFGVPLELIGARIGMIHGNRSTMKEARASFTDETLKPEWVRLAAALTHGLVPHYRDLDYLAFDLDTVQALQEDQDALHNRVRADMLAGIITREEARNRLGFDPEVKAGEAWVISSNITVSEAGTEFDEPEPAAPPLLPDGTPVPPSGKMVKTDLKVGSVGELEAIFGARQRAIEAGNGNGRHA